MTAYCRDICNGMISAVQSIMMFTWHAVH